MFNIVGFAQSSNFRAQGYYYKAKEYYESENFNTSLEYVKKSKDAIGGTNIQLQYLHIMVLVKQSNWIEAKKEMNIFYDIEEGTIKPNRFSDTVDELTDDEVYELTKILVDIEEKASYLESPEYKIKIQQKENRIKLCNYLATIIKSNYTWSYVYAHHDRYMVYSESWFSASPPSINITINANTSHSNQKWEAEINTNIEYLKYIFFYEGSDIIKLEFSKTLYFNHYKMGKLKRRPELFGSRVFLRLHDNIDIDLYIKKIQELNAVKVIYKKGDSYHLMRPTSFGG